MELLAAAWGTSTLVPLALHAPGMALVALPPGAGAPPGQAATSADAKFVQVRWAWSGCFAGWRGGVLWRGRGLLPRGRCGRRVPPARKWVVCGLPRSSCAGQPGSSEKSAAARLELKGLL